MGRLLDRINSPQDVKALRLAQLPELTQELRETILTTVSHVGGHFASSLGAVELIVALHYVFDAPTDQIVWDMGYQAYAHKLLTGRREQFSTLKQLGGISGFNNKEESPYDLFTTGHGGTAISTALGLATARDLTGARRRVVAVLGDASLGEGMALEALNHAGHVKERDFLVILNDNKWSIAPSVGAISRYLNRVITAPVYNRLRDDVESLLRRTPKYGSRLLRLAKQIEEGVKGMLVPGRLFEDLGFRYFGPIDGHDLNALITTLRNVKRLHGPMLIHTITQKGKGCSWAERDPERFHKVEPFDLKTGQPKRVEIKRRNGREFTSFTDAFTKTLVRLATSDKRVVAISAAMLEGTGLRPFQERFPDRCFDVGMAEQHGVGFGAGLARGGLRPVIAMYSTFLQRAYDQLFHEICLQDVPVVFAIDRAGLVGEDGPTHHGLFDIAYLRAFPRMTILSPKDETELAQMLTFAATFPGPISLRYSRGSSLPLSSPLRKATQPIKLGQAETLIAGEDIALWALGSMVYPAVEASRKLAQQHGVQPTVVNARFVKPLDRALLREIAQRHRLLITLEEAGLEGGFGSAVLEAVEEEGWRDLTVVRLGIPTAFIQHGQRDQLLEQVKLTPAGIVEQVAWALQRHELTPSYSVVRRDG